nr:reverse transcriptase domain-containing protein [Tanacetum cinerariifolium]
MACEEYSQEVLGFFDMIVSGIPTPYYDSIVSTTSQTLTPFGNSDFLLEEVVAFLALEDDPTSPEVDQSYLNSEGDILLLKAFLNDDPSLPPPNQGNYMPEVRKELKIYEAKSDKSLIDEPPEVDLKDLPPHLEYAFLEGDDKLPVIIAKYLSVEEKTALITLLKSHKRAIAWKLSDIKGTDPEFCSYKILMKEDFESADQEKTTFTCPYGTFAYRRMPFGLCNAPGTFQSCLSHLEKMLKRCEDTNLCLDWEKSHFMGKEGIVLGHKISKEGIEVDKAKVDVITKLPHPTTIKGIRSFLGHVGFYRHFIKDFSKIARPMTRLIEKDTSFIFSKECVEAFQTLKRKLTEALILIAPDWNMPFELMCDASGIDCHPYPQIQIPRKVEQFQNALQAMLPPDREEVRGGVRTGSGPAKAGGNPTPSTYHTWLERLNKQKPNSFGKATVPVDAENWISHMEKIFDVMGCED